MTGTSNLGFLLSEEEVGIGSSCADVFWSPKHSKLKMKSMWFKFVRNALCAIFVQRALLFFKADKISKLLKKC